MIKEKIIGTTASFIGICWIIGGGYGIITSIINGIILNDIIYTTGGICGAGFVLIAGIFTFQYGYKKIKEKTNLPNI